MANGTAQQDTSFLDKYKVPPPQTDDTSFLEKYRAQPAKPTITPRLGAEATGIGPHPFLDDPREARTEAFLNPTAAYKKEHPILGGLGEGLRNLRETFTPAARAASVLGMAPGGISGSPTPEPRAALPPSLGKQASPVIDLQLGKQGVYEAPTAPERTGPPRPQLGQQTSVEPLQRKPLAERRFGEAGRKPTIDSVVNQATGVKPLERNVPLGQQLEPRLGSVETDPIKAKYPDPEIRQLVRANGERIYQAAGSHPETMKAIHDLTRVDLRQALINSGEDMGQTTVSNSKFAGQGSITREDAFNKLLDKGLDPKEIVRLAKVKPEGAQ